VKNGTLTFSELAVGDTFEFAHERLAFHRDLAHGPWIKTGARRYQRFKPHVLDRHAREYHVGTVKASVRRGGCGGE
jgi:hypothetical protein